MLTAADAMDGQKPGKQDEEEDFYDCHETLEANKQFTEELINLQRLNLQTRERRAEEVSEERKEGGEEERIKTKDEDVLIEGDIEGATGGDEGKSQEREEEVAGFTAEEVEFSSEQVQLDEEYQLELEKELSNEDKENRRQQSLDLKDKGNLLFKNQQWADAESIYSEALGLCPLSYTAERAVLFSNRGAARVHLGAKDKAIADCSKALELNPQYLKALLRRAELYEQTDKLDEALDDYQKVLEKDPHNAAARGGAVRLPPLIHERNEKLKEEMMSKLKDLGNMILRPFGLSTSNFQLNQDQATGAYNINFVQNPNNNNR